MPASSSPPRKRRRSRFSTARDDSLSHSSPRKQGHPSRPSKPQSPEPVLSMQLTPLQPSNPPPLTGLSTNNLPHQSSQNLKSVFTDSDSDSDTPALRSSAASDFQKRPPLYPNPDVPTNIPNADTSDDHAEDPLDAYMETLSTVPTSHTVNNPSDVDSDQEVPDTGQTRRPAASTKRPVYERVDHSKIAYHHFEKALYRPVPELARLTPPEIAHVRRTHSIRIRGRGCPAPLSHWAQAGLSGTILAVLDRCGYDTPTPIQMQGIPCMMSGRDMIGVARTGSGKTLAFLLPVLRHIGLQRRAMAGDGPAALVVAPTRELAIQIYREVGKFREAARLRSVCAYGGSGVKEQIAELKRGADVVICTPGRMIDLLAMNSGRITNLRRVTIVVLDEADRMFDMGFEPQLTRIVENIRPDRQTVMFSATFPSQVEKLARKVLKHPIEIMVGGNSVAASTIDQHVEVRKEDSKFFRLLELLGFWYEKGSTLVFVDRQDNADRIFRDLSKARYKCLSLHGGMDQADRDSAIVDFKNGDIKVLVATSVAARGLDVKNLTLVVNFDVPSHYEDYVHRVGRTGRAGRHGTAYTFITPEQEAFAPDLVKALELSARAASEHTAQIRDKDSAKRAGDEAATMAVPEELRKMADTFELKRKAGIVKHKPSSGYGGKGFSFDNNDEYDAAKIAIRKMQAKQYGIEDEVGDDEQNGDEIMREVLPREKVEESNEEEEDDDGIVEITIAPKASGATTDITGAALPGSKSNSTKELTQEEIDALLAEAVKKAELEADRQNLNSSMRSARIAMAKANVLSIAAIQNKKAKSAKLGTQSLQQTAPSVLEGQRTAEVSLAAAAAAAISAKFGSAARGNVGDVREPAKVGEQQSGLDANSTRFAGELEINDYPQHARWQVTKKGALSDVEEFTGCVITTRGNFYPAGRNPPAGERKLHFLIEGPSRNAVKTARRDIRQKLEEAAAVSRPGDTQYSKYSVV
eukprot:GFKZ01012080.1.p1 GENE.GFKZ01012080.1~~GFKZ01012080.1.p1  ORF type:complete len:997 (+),score=164.82 GFKZ01012080.1:60-2993(+)